MRFSRLAAVGVLGIAAWAGGALLATVPAAACNTSAANTTCSPDMLATSTSSTFVQRETGTLDSCPTFNNICFNASYVEEVYHDPANTFCANCLDWLIQLTDNTVPSSDTADPIDNITIGDFAGFKTDQGVDTNAPPAGSEITNSGTATPCDVNRNQNGTVLAWQYGVGPSSCPEILPGQTTVILDVMTNATTVVPGEISAQDQSSAENAGLAPALPEAPFVAGFLLVGGGVTTVLLRRRSRRQQG